MDIPEGLVHCGRCKTRRPQEEFAPSQQRNGGWCRPCLKVWYREKRPALPPRACEVCAAVVEEPKPRQRFCSAACKMKARYWRNNPRETRACIACGTDITEMRRDARFCSSACAQRDKVTSGRQTPAHRRAIMLKRHYGMTPEDYERLLVEQDSGCAICGASGETSRYSLLHVDHCHDSGTVRGLLCMACNHGLGQFKDDPARLRAAAEYLER